MAAPGKEAPSFQLDSLDHDRFYLREQHGKPVVLLFWDTSCEVCKREMVDLEQLRQAMGPGRVAMASVCADPENIDLARRLVQGLRLGFPTLLDRDGRVTRTYGVKAFPTTMAIAPDGKIGLVREGYTEPLMRQLRSVLEGYLEGASDGR